MSESTSKRRSAAAIETQGSLRFQSEGKRFLLGRHASPHRGEQRRFRAWADKGGLSVPPDDLAAEVFFTNFYLAWRPVLHLEEEVTRSRHSEICITGIGSGPGNKARCSQSQEGPVKSLTCRCWNVIALR